MARRDHRKGSLPYPFVAIPKPVLESADWKQLPGSSVKLLIDLAAQYTGKNNGRLCPSFEVMKRDAGWNSPAKLIRAKTRLLEAHFVVLTRKGHAPRTAEWFGLTWWKLDYHASMDVDPKKFPYLNFATLSVVPKRYDEGPKQAPGRTETEPLARSKPA